MTDDRDEEATFALGTSDAQFERINMHAQATDILRGLAASVGA
jgi:hypothetical protein